MSLFQGRTSDTPTAVVLNIGFAGLGAVRSLGRAGIPVIGLDPDPSHAGFASRYCVARTCPHPVHEPEQLADFLMRLGGELLVPAVLSPASDAFVLFVSRYREMLEEHFRFNLPQAEVLESLVNKRKLYELADRIGVDHASLAYPESLDEVHAIKHELDYPVYLKPYTSHLWQLAFPHLPKGVTARSPDELVARFEMILPTGVRVMIQSIIAGPPGNVGTVYAYLSRNRELLGAVTTRKIRQYPVDFGRGTLAETVSDPDLLARGLRFFQAIGYRGFGTVEFKLDDTDGKSKLTDVNPRWVGPIALPIASSVDFPLIHYLDLTGQTPPPVTRYRTGVRWLDPVRDIATSLPAIRSGELSAWNWLQSLGGTRAYPELALDDPGPALKEYQYGLRLLKAPLRIWRFR